MDPLARVLTSSSLSRHRDRAGTPACGVLGGRNAKVEGDAAVHAYREQLFEFFLLPELGMTIWSAGY